MNIKDKISKLPKDMQDDLVKVNIEIYEKQFNRMVQINLSKYIEFEKIGSLNKKANHADFFNIREEAKDIANNADSHMKVDTIDNDGFIKIHLTIIFGNKTIIKTLSVNTNVESYLHCIVPAMKSFTRSACHELIKGKT